MKRTTLFLATLALMLGFISCKQPEKKEEITAVVVDPSMIQLKLGETETAKLHVKWTPSTVKATPEFISENPEVATVSGDGQVGEVKAVAEGTTTITVKVGGKSASAAVVVTKKSNSTPEVQNQLPFFSFDENDEEAMKARLEWESKLGRELKEDVSVQKTDKGYNKMPAFVSEQLDLIPVVAYDLWIGKMPVIAALGKEPLANYEKTLKMLQDNGFPSAKISVSATGRRQLEGYGKNDKDDLIELVGREQVITNQQGQPDTNSIIIFALKKRLPDAQQFHTTLPDVKDFPGIEAFLEGDKDKIDEYENALGFREFSQENSKNGNFWFATKSDDILAKTNFVLVYYIMNPANGPKFINSALASIKNREDFDTPEFKNWLKVNGFDTDVNFQGDMIECKNSDGTLLLQCFLMDTEKGYSLALLQIVSLSDMKSTSSAELRANAIQSFEQFVWKGSSSFEYNKNLQLTKRK